MDTYSILRQLADSWVLLVMFGIFVGIVLWAFRPGGSKTYDEIANIPLKDDDTLPHDDPAAQDGTRKEKQND
ncbi:cbb3-type cytochrome c oxidase subunit 3 [Roseovarius arcticus]|uniref:cbb3-type cytochrome c oxidase subunit 3 n=1 Tax=Roseovarius arcticus TaxID=2547404 RepID=UPI001110AE74|nr:cbb3-type cytochrome c oxidase subunit 3 [Roseovarius arcticus]